MSSTPTHYRLLLISPSDVDEERSAVRNALHEWNEHIGRVLDLHLDVVGWEQARPQLAEEPQAAINEQVVSGCDFAVGIFWSRLGTPTRGFDSGSVEEIELMREAGKDVLLYFKNAAIPQRAVADGQAGGLLEFKRKVGSGALYGSFDGIDDLRTQLVFHVTGAALKIHGNNPSSGLSAVSSTLPALDVRVEVSGRRTKPEQILIRIENHSPMPVYLEKIGWVDAGGDPQLRPILASANEVLTLRPADSHVHAFQSFQLPNSLSQASRIIITDRINRVYRSTSGQLCEAVEAARRAQRERLRCELHEWRGSPPLLSQTLAESAAVGFGTEAMSIVDERAEKIPKHQIVFFLDGLAGYIESDRDAREWKTPLASAGMRALGRLPKDVQVEWYLRDSRDLTLRAWLLDAPGLSGAVEAEFAKRLRDYFERSIERAPDAAGVFRVWLQVAPTDDVAKWVGQALRAESHVRDVAATVDLFFVYPEEDTPQLDGALVRQVDASDALASAMDWIMTTNAQVASWVGPLRDVFHQADRS